MKRTVIKKFLAAMLCMMMLMQNVPFSVIAEYLIADDNSWAAAMEDEPDEAAETSEFSSEELDFSSMRLLVCTENEGDLFSSVPTTILSEFEGVYLLSFESEAETREAYYYYSEAEITAEPDIALFVADDAYLQNENPAAATDALTRLSELLDDNSDTNAYDLALIDTGTSGGGVSVISESAEDDNGHGGKMYEVISEVSPTLSVLSVKAFDSHGIGSVASVYAAICYAVRKDVDVIDLSFAAHSAADSPVLERAVSMATEKGVIVIGAAGNNHADAGSYIPGRVPGVLIAGACDDSGLALPSSNFGETVFCNVAAQSTSEAAARLSAMAAVYGMEQVEAKMGSGVVFRCGEIVLENIQSVEEISPIADAPDIEPETSENTEAEDISPNDETDGDISYPDFDRNYPPEQTPVTGNGVTIDHVYLRWLSQGSEGSQPFGTLFLDPETENSPNQQFQIDFDLSGQYPYEPNSVQIIIPAYLWQDRDGNECGTLTLSVPEEPETGAEFSWRREGDQIIITNVRTLPAASKIMIQGTFRNIDASEIKDDTLESFQATVTVKEQGGTISMNSNDISAHMDTHIKVNSSSKTAYDGTTGKYTVWWKETPPDMPNELLPEGMDPAEYLFVRWYVSGEAAGNQPFKMYVDDNINGYPGGVMLGVSHCAEPGGFKKPDENGNVHALLYDGFSTLPQTAYVWTAYKIDELKNDEGFDFTTIPNNQTITVIGDDDRARAEAEGNEPESSTRDADAFIEVKEPTEYTFTKKWVDDDDEDGHRPEYIDIKIHSKTLGKTTNVRLYPPNGGGDEWTYKWTDNGQSQQFTVEEILSNADGYDMEFYDTELHRYEWNYSLSTNVEDGYINGEDNQWFFPNVYDQKWVNGQGASFGGIDSIKKNSVYAFSDASLISKRDGLSLNKLMLGQDVYVPYIIDTTVSAADQYLADRRKNTVFTLEDSEYYLGKRESALDIADIDIGAVTFTVLEVYRYSEDPQTHETNSEIPEGSTWYAKERIVPPETTLYGLIEGNWVKIAVWTPPAGDGTEGSGSLTSQYPGVEISGKRILLPKGFSGIKMQLAEAAAFVHFECQPEVRLHPTQRVKEMIQACYNGEIENAVLSLYNNARSYAAEKDNEENIYVTQNSSDFAYLHGKQYKIAADMNKSYNLTKNDTAKKQLVLHAQLEMTQQSNILSLEDFRAAATNKEIPYSQGGTYYDLLPHGVEPDISTIKLTEGDILLGTDIKTNYKDSGRTLLIVQVAFAENLSFSSRSKYYGDPSYPAEGYRSSHVLEFDSYILHDTYRNDLDVDKENFHNTAAFEAQEDKIGSIEGWQGEKDDPTGDWSAGNKNQHKRSHEAGSNAELEIMKDLDPFNDDPSFVYAGANVRTDEIDVSSQSGLEKYVKAAGFGSWSTGVGRDEPVNVEEGGQYLYRLQVSSAQSDTRDIVVIDSLENYYIHGGETNFEILDEKKRWYGYLESIDVSAAEAKGARIVIYYYTGADRPMVRYYGELGNTEEVMKKLNSADGGWTSVKPDNMASVKAVAFDMRYTKDDQPFILKEGDSIPILLYMRAPDISTDPEGNYLDDDDPTDPNKNGHAYNEIYMSCSYTDSDAGASVTGYSYVYWDYTKIGIRSKDIKVIKAWDDADDADGIRPKSVKVWLLANGKKVSETPLELNDANGWTGIFKRLRTYDNNGDLIVYSVEEESVDGYRSQIALSYENGKTVFTLNNIHDPQKTSIPVTKLWNFGTDGSEEMLPGSITFRLLADGVETGDTLTVKPDANGRWYGEFTDLIKKKKGVDIVYTVKEDPITDFVQVGCKEVNNGGFEFTNEYHPYGDIVLTKTVIDGTDASTEYNLDKDNEHPFLFTLQLYTEDAEGNRNVVTNKYSYYIYDSSYGTIQNFIKAIEADKEGKITAYGPVGNGDRISLLEEQQIIIKDIPSKVKYILTESTRKEYELSGTVGGEGSIQSGQLAQAEFTNRYITKGTAVIKAEKTLTGRTLNGYQFRFELRDENDKLIRSAYNDAEGKVTFNIGYSNEDSEKTFTYHIREVNTGMDGYEYDTACFMVTVKPVDKGDGTMDCSDIQYSYCTDPKHNPKIEETPERSGDPEFKNEYHADGKVKFVAWKDLDGRTLKAKEFTFKLYDQAGIENLAQEDAPLQTRFNTDDGVITFDELEFHETDAGKTYRYYAYEVNGTDDTVVYDAHVICYVVEVIDNGDGTLDFNQSTYILNDVHDLDCQVCGGTGKDGKEEKCTECRGLGFIEKDANDTPVFRNSLEPGLLSVTKKVSVPDNNEYPNDTEFRFHIRLVGDKITPDMKIEDSEGNTYTLNENGEFTVEVGIGQTITFKDIPAGTAYQVWEDNEAGWYLSGRRNVSGLIEAKKTAEAELTNTYDKNSTRAVIVGTKLLDNKPAHKFGDETFKFQLVELVNGDEILIGEPVKAEEGGFIQFNIDYKIEDEGTHTYYIREVEGDNKDKVVYDDHEEIVKVTVQVDAKGFLKTVVEYVDNGDDQDGAVRFENFTAPGALKISKLGDGLNTLNDRLFTFEVSLFNENGVPLSDDELEWYLVDRDGKDKEPDTSDTDADKEKKSPSGRFEIDWKKVIRTFGNTSVKRADPADAGGTTGYEPPSIDELEQMISNQSAEVLKTDKSSDDSTVKWSIIRTDRKVTLSNTGTEVNEVILLIEPTNGSTTGEFKGSGVGNGKYGWTENSNINSVTTILTKGELSLRNIELGNSMFNKCTNLVYANLSCIDLSYTGTGTNNQLTSMFNGCNNLVTAKFSGKPITGRRSLGFIFNNCYKLEKVEGLCIQYDGANTVDCEAMFQNCSSITSINLESWNVTSQMVGKSMFFGCSKLTGITFGKNWKNTRLTTMYSMFRNCYELINVDVENLNTASVTDMGLVFLNCTKLPLTTEKLKDWDTSSVTSFQETFSGCKAIENLNLSSWKTGNALSMHQMFYNSGIKGLKVEGWDVGNVTTMKQMFGNCGSLGELDLSKWKWKEGEGKLTTLEGTFLSCTSMTTLNVSGWNTLAVTTLQSTFDNCRSLTSITGLEDWHTDNVLTMQQTFMKCKYLTSVDVDEWNTSKVQSMYRMFDMTQDTGNTEGNIISLDLSSWNTANVTNMGLMFSYCTRLENIKFGENWNTSNVTNMQQMFARCWALSSDCLEAVENFDTGKVTDMNLMFLECRKLTSLDLSKWNTGNVTNMAQMFQDCQALKKLDIGNFNTAKVTSMSNMFNKCSALEILDIGGFDTAAVTNMTTMFNSCNNIKEITLSASFYAAAGVVYEGGKLCNVPTTSPYNGTWVQKDELNLLVRKTYTSQELMAMLRADPTLQETTYVWDTQNYYKVHFDPGAGNDTYDGSMSDGRCAADAAYVLPENRYTRYGYVFTGWLDEDWEDPITGEKGRIYPVGDDGKVTIPADTYRKDDEITLKAQWVKYDVTKGLPYYIDIYKEKYDNNETKEYELAYTLVGYITDKSGMKKITLPDDSIDEPFYIAPETKEYVISAANGIMHIPLYYNLKRFTIQFDANPDPDDGDTITGSMEKIEMVGDSACVLENSYINGSKRFVGWNTEKDGSGRSYGAVNPYTTNDFDFTQGETITLYAIWVSNSTTITPTAGKIIVQCKAGETIVFPNLPAGTVYTVKEINIPSGWTQSALSNNGTLVSGGEAKGTIISNEYVQVQAVNVYRAAGGEILQAHKRYDGDTLTQGEFTFDLFTLSDVQYSYTQNFNADGSSGAFYPHESYDGSVSITDAEKLFVVLQYFADDETEDQTGASVEVLGTNDKLLYKLKGSGTEYLNIEGNTVRFKANCDKGVADYHAAVYKVNTIDTAVNGSPDQLTEIQDKNGEFVTNEWYNTGLVTFEMQNYTEPGEYVYYIHERKTNDSTIEFDEHTVMAVVTVTDRGDGTLATEVKYYDLDADMNAQEASGALFVNKKITGQLELEKRLIDASGAVGDTEFQFIIHLNDASGNPLNGTFELVEGEYTEPFEEGTEKPPDSSSTAPATTTAPAGSTESTESTETTVTTEAADPPVSPEPPENKPNTVTFENGVYVLTIKGGEKFTIVGLPDGAKYTVEEVPLNYFEQTGATGTDGRIKSSTTSKAEITNTYKTSDELPLTAVKHFIGGDLSKYTFEFVLMNHAHEVVQRVTCDSDGVISFAKIEFTEADIGRDIFYYISEVKGTDSSIQYDTEEKCVMIHVDKDENNRIQLTAYVLDPKTGQYDVPYTEKEQLPFTNVYLYDITVSKSVTGDFADKGKKFRFTLKLNNKTYTLPGIITCKSSSGTQEMTLDDGELSFELSHGETLTFSGLPPDTDYTIIEAEDQDYTPEITVTGDENAISDKGTVSGTLSANIAVSYLNTCKIEGDLPGAGYLGGTKWIYLLGTAVIFSGLLQGALYVRRRRRDEEDTAL